MSILLVIDVESTCWNNKYSAKRKSEIIEIGGAIIKIEDNDFIILDKFYEFVRPILHPKLSDFCKEFTTINQSDIDNAEIFPDALRNFRNKAKKAVGGMSCRKMIFGSWGKYDRKAIRRDCKLHSIRYPFGKYVDLSEKFSEHKRTNQLYSVDKALSDAGLFFKGIPHRAFYDAWNTAIIVKKRRLIK